MMWLVFAFRNSLINITDSNRMKLCRFSQFNNLYRLEQHDSMRASMASYPIKKSVVDFLSGRYDAVSQPEKASCSFQSKFARIFRGVIVHGSGGQ